MNDVKNTPPTAGRVAGTMISDTTETAAGLNLIRYDEKFAVFAEPQQARLVASAPELLSALKNITFRFIDLLGSGIENCEGNGQVYGDAEAIYAAQSAIIKAEGGAA